jgi:hypothetical protein
MTIVTIWAKSASGKARKREMSYDSSRLRPIAGAADAGESSGDVARKMICLIRDLATYVWLTTKCAAAEEDQCV